MTELPDIAARAETVALVRRALEEDVGEGDVTTLALVPDSLMVEAAILTRAECVVTGARIADLVLRAVDSRLSSDIEVSDGQHAAAGQTIMRVCGPARGLLTAERTALNFLQRLCGIATLTRRFVDRASPFGVAILDTRKTTPGLRILEKYAVLCGGGQNHRMGLYDRILIKDNHRCLWSRGAGVPGAPTLLSLAGAISMARERFPAIPIEIEVESEAELRDALSARPDWVLLDNMAPALLRRCAALCKGICRVEASGGITLATLDEVLLTGVDAISLGCLTHSAPAVDLSLEIL